MSISTIDGMKYDHLLEMASGFQWLQEKDGIRLAVRESGAGAVADEVLNDLNTVSGQLALLEMRGLLSEIGTGSLLPTPLFQSGRFGICSREVAEKAVELEEKGIDRLLTGHQNFYAVAYALIIRGKFPKRWNRFCDQVDQPGWKAILVTSVAPGVELTIQLDESAELPDIEEIGAGKTENDRHSDGRPITGFAANAFKNAEFNALSDLVMQDGSGTTGSVNVDSKEAVDQESKNRNFKSLEDRLYEALAEEAAVRKKSRGFGRG